MFRTLNSLRKAHVFSNYTYLRCHSILKKALSSSTIHHAKLFLDRENDYCYGLLAPLYDPKKILLQPPISHHQETMTDETFNNTMKQLFRKSSATEIVATFEQVLPYCNLHSISIADTRFDHLVDGLVDNAEKLSDNELLQLLDLLHEYPACETLKDHNFHDVWSCLDDMCCWRVQRWDEDMLFAVSERWFKLNLGKVCDFIFEAVDKMSRKPEKKLSKEQLVNAFFLMNVNRKRNVQFEYEHALYQKVDQLTVDEMAIVALGYFKTQSKIKIPQILGEMLRKAKEAEGIHEISLCAILKVVRFASHPLLADQIFDFLVYITPKLETFSTLCMLHATLLGTTLQIQYRPALKIAAQRIVSNITNTEEVRLKDIERLMFALTMFDYDPETTPCIFQAALAEMNEDRRIPELTRHPRCLGAALSYLALRNIYSVPLMQKVLEKQYIEEVYGKTAKIFPRELFILDTNIDIEVNDYKGPRLDIIKRRKVSKWLTAFTPTKQQRNVTAVEKLVLQVLDSVEKIVGSTDKLFVDHILPQYLRADIVICRDKNSKQFVKPSSFERYELGDVMKPPKLDDLEYFALVIVGWNNTIRNTSLPVGMINMKTRHLAKIGYKPITVIWNEYLPLSDTEKRKYIEDKINNSC